MPIDHLIKTTFLRSQIVVNPEFLVEVRTCLKP